jgi:hypothetical protein
VRLEASRTFSNKMRDYLKEKLMSLRHKWSLEKGYQRRSKLGKDDNEDLLAYSHNSLNRHKDYFCQLLNVHGVNDVRQTEKYTVEPFTLNLLLSRLRSLLNSWTDINHQVLIKFRQNWSKQEVVHYIPRPTNLLVVFGIRKNCHISGRDLHILLYLFIKTVLNWLVIIVGYSYY